MHTCRCCHQAPRHAGPVRAAVRAPHLALLPAGQGSRCVAASRKDGHGALLPAGATAAISRCGRMPTSTRPARSCTGRVVASVEQLRQDAWAAEVPAPSSKRGLLAARAPCSTGACAIVRAGAQRWLLQPYLRCFGELRPGWGRAAAGTPPQGTQPCCVGRSSRAGCWLHAP